MVKILANGDIVPDTDPRARSGGQTQGSQATIHQSSNREPVAHAPDASIFDTLNQRVLDLGLPAFNIPGGYVIQPIVSIGFLLAFFLMGLPGILFALLLFFIAQTSGLSGSRQAEDGSGGRGWQGRNMGGQNPPGGGGHGSSNQKNGWKAGGGHRLGRS